MNIATACGCDIVNTVLKRALQEWVGENTAHPTHGHAARCEWAPSLAGELLTFLVMTVTLGTVASANA